MPSIALVGCGYWGKNLARTLAQLGALRLVCEGSDAGRQQAARLAPGVPVSDQFDQALDKGIDAVVLATPAETHFPLAARALQAGKDVFVEKPLALSLEHGMQLVELARRSGRILFVGHLLLYHPGVVALHELIRAGELGQLHFLRSHRLSLGKVRLQENVLWSFAPHDIAICLRLADESAVQTAAFGGVFLQPEIADVCTLDIRFASGAQAHILVSWLYPFKEHRLVAVGARRMACLDDVSKKLVLYDSRVEWRGQEPVLVQGEARSIAFPSDEPLRLECEAFIDCLRTRREPLTSGMSALQVLQVLEAGQRSLNQNGVPVSLVSVPDRAQS